VFGWLNSLERTFCLSDVFERGVPTVPMGLHLKRERTPSRFGEAVGWLRILILDRLEILPRSVVLILALCLCILVGVTDSICGPEFSFVTLYFIPIFIGAWFLGRIAGFFLSFACALTWLITQMIGRSFQDYNFAIYWNDFMELLLFLMTTVVVSSLRGALDRENGLARKDHLTNIPNRRHYYELVEAEVKRNQRYGDPFTVVLMDIDNFKLINDNKGHFEGDILLQRVALSIASAVRNTDTVARVGGDEFAMLLPNTEEESALKVVEKLDLQLKVDVEKRWPITFSVGVVTYNKTDGNIDNVIGLADQIMYKVKKTGKNAMSHEVVGSPKSLFDFDFENRPN
jgi:diguanylate cyclase (GGDEF)-like protein